MRHTPTILVNGSRQSLSKHGAVRTGRSRVACPPAVSGGAAWASPRCGLRAPGGAAVTFDVGRLPRGYQLGHLLGASSTLVRAYRGLCTLPPADRLCVFSFHKTERKGNFFSRDLMSAEEAKHSRSRGDRDTEIAVRLCVSR